MLPLQGHEPGTSGRPDCMWQCAGLTGGIRTPLSVMIETWLQWLSQIGSYFVPKSLELDRWLKGGTIVWRNHQGRSLPLTSDLPISDCGFCLQGPRRLSYLRPSVAFWRERRRKWCRRRGGACSRKAKLSRKFQLTYVNGLIEPNCVTCSVLAEPEDIPNSGIVSKEGGSILVR